MDARAMKGPPAKEEMEEENLWSSILKEVQSRSSAALPQASVVVLGDGGSGKTSLVNRLQRKESGRTGAGMEYHCLEVNPDFKDGTYAYQLGSALGDPTPGESGRLGVWVLGGASDLSPLLRFALPPSLLPNSAALLCASLAQPWAIMESLKRWSKLLDAFLNQQDPHLLAQSREAQVRFWQEYVEPLDSSSHSEGGAKVPSMEADAILLPLSDGTLSHNLGLPLIVVLTHSDRMGELDKEYGFKDEHMDFVQAHLRRFCLNYGAALFYTSAKEGRNCDELYKYLLHRLFRFPFTRPASVLHRDSVFIPAGWDNEKKLAILHEQLGSNIRPDDLFEEHMKKPILRRPQAKDTDVAADDDQAFLVRAQSLLAQQPKHAAPAAAGGADSPSHTPARNLRTASSVTNATPAPKLADQGKTATIAASAQPQATPDKGGGEGVLAHFFNNLLTQKAATGTPGKAEGGGGRGSLPKPPARNGDDPRAISESQKEEELQKMLQKVSAAAPNNAHPPPDSSTA